MCKSDSVSPRDCGYFSHCIETNSIPLAQEPLTVVNMYNIGAVAGRAFLYIITYVKTLGTNNINGLAKYHTNKVA